MDSTAQTVAAVQTPCGRGGIAVVCLRGPGAASILDSIFRPLTSHAAGGEGILQLGHLVVGGRVLDEAVVHRRQAGAEINVHGGPQVARAVLEALADRGATVGASAPSGPDSFGLAHPRWDNPAIGREMLDALPLARSALVVAAVTQQWSAGISRLARSREATAEQFAAAAAGLAPMRRLLEPPEVVIAGPPNVGKSTLANALVGRNVSIVHEMPGTTRDWVRELALLDGIPVWLTDTAGIWEAPDDVDAEAVHRARQCIDRADLVVLLTAGRDAEVPDWLDAGRLVVVSTKCDVCRPAAGAAAAVSALTGQGLDGLKGLILRELGLGEFDPTVPRAFTSRQAEMLGRASGALREARPQTARSALRRLLHG